MRVVCSVVTNDGKVHKDGIDALKYLEEQYQNLLGRIAHRLVHKAEKYLTLKDGIESELDSLKLLLELDAEMKAGITIDEV